MPPRKLRNCAATRGADQLRQIGRELGGARLDVSDQHDASVVQLELHGASVAHALQLRFTELAPFAARRLHRHHHQGRTIQDARQRHADHVVRIVRGLGVLHGSIAQDGHRLGVFNWVFDQSLQVGEPIVVVVADVLVHDQDLRVDVRRQRVGLR